MENYRNLSVRKEESEFKHNGSILMKSLKTVGESLMPAKYCAICGQKTQRDIPIIDGYCPVHLHALNYNCI